MPYIKVADRTKFDNAIMELSENITCAGELNYVITRVIHRYLRKHGACYQTMNDIVGALDNAKDEFRRRVQHPYENQKIEQNGDVHPNNL